MYVALVVVPSALAWRCIVYNLAAFTMYQVLTRRF